MAQPTFQLTAHAEGVLEAFNESDWHAMRDLVGDATYHDYGGQRSVEGADALIEYLKAWKTAMPDVTAMVTNAFENGWHVVLELTWHGTHTGEFVTKEGTIPPSGKRQMKHAAWIFEYDESGPKESRLYYDLLTVRQQIGAAQNLVGLSSNGPPPGSALALSR